VKKEQPAPAVKAKGGPVLGSGKPSGKKSVPVEQDWIDAMGGGELGRQKAAKYLKEFQK
jgi:hypothetical protein